MFARITQHSNRLKATAALASALAITSAATPALAGTQVVATGGLSQLEYSGNLLTFQVAGGANYAAQTTAVTGTGCSIPALSLDTLKLWASMGQASLLSGKTLTFYVNTCNGTAWIYDVVLVK